MVPYGMDRIIKIIVNTVFIIVIIAVAVNAVSLYTHYTVVKKVARTMIFYAQKNGGFVNSVDMDGNVLYDVNNFYNELKSTYKLEDIIISETFKPRIGEKVIRKNSDNELDNTAIVSFEIEIKSRVEVFIPFGDDYYLNLPTVKEVGFSQKYFKD